MPALDAPSPTPSNMPPPSNLKRPRQSIPTTTTTTTLQPRAKRRKPEENVERESGLRDRDKTRSLQFGVGMVKGREEGWGEQGDVQTKVRRDSACQPFKHVLIVCRSPFRGCRLTSTSYLSRRCIDTLSIMIYYLDGMYRLGLKNLVHRVSRAPLSP